ncbi:4Fe-4S dicluster domain-containing protein [Candidatus Woesearchaeota archaeon]|nr:4Fe-4S dicluster domain-containing protein [Candidatus Woesearchaeota archaeon]
MRVLKQKKKRLFEFLGKLKQSYELIAPVSKDVVRFEKIDDTGDIYLEKNSYFPLKEYFFRKEEVLFKFNGNKIIVPAPEAPARVFFGIRKCDLNAISHQDMVFMNQVNDPYYSSMRKNSFLLGYHCNTAPSPFCFCGSLELVDYSDLMFYDRGDYLLVEIGSEKGKFLAGKFREFFVETNAAITQKEKIIPRADRLDKKDISHLYDHPDWKKGVDICLSCSACTALCPTCYCFEIHDNVGTKNPKEGERKRSWSSCQVQEFTKVAGEHVFRKEREERFKHRIYHQLDYFKQKNGINLCVGCGRCIEACPTRIDFVEIINEMK